MWSQRRTGDTRTETRLLSLDELIEQAFHLRERSPVTLTLIKFSPTESAHELTIFKDGRAIVQGTEDLAEARSLYSRYIGA